MAAPVVARVSAARFPMVCALVVMPFFVVSLIGVPLDPSDADIAGPKSPDVAATSFQRSACEVGWWRGFGWRGCQ